jgi:hypothetical protein
MRETLLGSINLPPPTYCSLVSSTCFSPAVDSLWSVVLICCIPQVPSVSPWRIKNTRELILDEMQAGNLSARCCVGLERTAPRYCSCAVGHNIHLESEHRASDPFDMMSFPRNKHVHTYFTAEIAVRTLSGYTPIG